MRTGLPLVVMVLAGLCSGALAIAAPDPSADKPRSFTITPKTEAQIEQETAEYLPGQPSARDIEGSRRGILRHSAQWAIVNTWLATGKLLLDQGQAYYPCRSFHYLKDIYGKMLLFQPRHSNLPGVRLVPESENLSSYEVLDSAGVKAEFGQFQVDSDLASRISGLREAKKKFLSGQAQAPDFTMRDGLDPNAILQWSPLLEDRTLAQWESESLMLLTEHYRLTGELPRSWEDMLDLVDVGYVRYAIRPYAEKQNWFKSPPSNRHAEVLIDVDREKLIIKMVLRFADSRIQDPKYYQLSAAGPDGPVMLGGVYDTEFRKDVGLVPFVRVELFPPSPN